MKDRNIFLIIYNLIIMAICLVFFNKLEYIIIVLLHFIYILFNNYKLEMPNINNPFMNYDFNINKKKTSKFNKNLVNKFTDDPIFKKIPDKYINRKFNRFFYTKPTNTYINYF